jgi:hypothetical protein
MSAYSGDRDRRFRAQRDRRFRSIVTAVTARGVARSNFRLIGHDASLGLSFLLTFSSAAETRP